MTTACRTGQLDVVPATAKVEGGTRTQMLTTTNTGTGACTMSGYPSVAPYRTQVGGGGSSSVQARLEPIPLQTGPLGARPQTLTLQPKQAAVFFLLWSTGGGSCQDADGISFDTPVSSMPAPVAFPFRFCGNTIRQSVMLPLGTAA